MQLPNSSILEEVKKKQRPKWLSFDRKVEFELMIGKNETGLSTHAP
jgi:hypothetical protein